MRSILSPETTTTVSRSVAPLPSSRVATLRAIGRLGCGSPHVSGGLFATPSSAADGCDCTDLMRLIASCPKLEDVLGRHAKHDLTDRLVVQDAPLALLRDRVDVAQAAFERVFLEHRHRAAIVKQHIDDLA